MLKVTYCAIVINNRCTLLGIEEAGGGPRRSLSTLSANSLFILLLYRIYTRMDKIVQYLQNDRRSSSIPASFSLYFLHRDIRKRYWALTVNRYLPTSSTSSLFCGNFFLFSSHLKGPKHDQVGSGFFYTNQTHMVR